MTPTTWRGQQRRICGVFFIVYTETYTKVFNSFFWIKFYILSIILLGKIVSNAV